MAEAKKSERWLSVFTDFVKLLRIDSKEVAAVDDKGSPLDLWGSQRRFLEAVCTGLDQGKRVFYCLKSRQVGLTTLSLAFDVFWLAMYPATIGALVTDTPKNSAANRRAIRRYIESIPKSFFGKSFTIVDDNRDFLTFNNGSRLDLLVAGTRNKKTWGEGVGYVFAHLCAAKGTPVVVEHGRIKLIEDVKVGDKVLTHTGKEARVIDVFGQSGIDKPMIEVTPWLGAPIRYTTWHKIPTQRGLVQAGELRKDDFLIMPVREITASVLELELPDSGFRTGKHYVNKLGQFVSSSAVGAIFRIRDKWKTIDTPIEKKIILNEEFGFAMGYYLAEGCMIKNRSGKPCAITFTRHRNEKHYTDRVCEVLKPYTTGHRRTNDQKNSLTTHETIYGASLARWVNENFGSLDDKHIPDKVFTWGKEFCRGLIAGFLSGDGSKSVVKGRTRAREHKETLGSKGNKLGKKRTSVTLKTYNLNSVILPTTRASLAMQSRDIIASLGYGWGSLSYKEGGQHYGRNCKPCWRVVWNGEPAVHLRRLMGLPTIKRKGYNFINKYILEEDRVLIKIKNIKDCPEEKEVWDISVDHSDHTFRTPYMSTSNTEVASYGSKEGLDSFREALAANHPNRFVIYEGTAKGFNHWRDMWIAAKRDEHTCVTVFVGWWSKDINRIKKTDPRYSVFNSEPTSEEQELIDAVEEQYNFKISMEQLAWYRWKASADDVDINTLYQNQPWCVTAETRVGTDKGILKIKDISVGLEGSLGKVIASGPTGKSVIWCATTRLGYKIRGTANHPLITTDGKQIDLSESFGFRIKLQPPRFGLNEKIVTWKDGVTESFVRITPDLARFVGLFMGDGHLSSHHNGRGTAQSFQFSIACTGRDRDTVDECHRLLKNLFGITAQEKHDYKDGPQGGCITVRCGSRLIWETFTKLGLLRTDTTATRRKVHVPDFIWESPKEVAKEFLRGLFEADGFNDFKSPRVVFSTKYPAFAQEVQLLLLAFGITCKVTQCTPKIGVKTYSAMNVALRTAESIKFNQDIGFISSRKKDKFKLPPVRGKGWKYRVAPPIVFEDEIISVVNEGVEEDVYNLTIEGEHLFDANGILTHNTESQAFVMTGFSFFQTRVLQQDLQRIQNPDDPLSFKGYRYLLGNDFQAGIMEPIDRMDRIDEVRLRVWEDPIEGAEYVIGCDPAWGRNEWKDRTAIEIYRCFADKLVQVAEYADNDVDTRQAAWVLAHLAGAYRNCKINIELTGGPGRAVMTELEHLRDRVRSEMYREKLRKDFEWDDFLATASWYLYRKVDSSGAGYAKGFDTNMSTKWELMCQIKDSHSTGMLLIRSVPLVEEMLTVVQDGAEIGAPGRSKDDRMFATALANRAWIDSVRPRMIQSGETYELVIQQELDGIERKEASFVDQIVMNFMQKQAEYEEPVSPRQQWLSDRGFNG